MRFTKEEIEKYKKIKIFLCIPATGKSYLASVDKRFVDIDGEEADYKYDYPKDMPIDDFSRHQGHSKVVRFDSEEYIHKKLLEHLADGKIILSATHKHILEFLDEKKLPYIIVQYHVDEVEHFKDRMRKRGNTEDFIEAMTKNRAESYINHKKDPNAVACIDIHEGEYLMDLMYEIFGDGKK